jgi:uroporphyrinogen-III decarboxylase
MQPLDRLPFWPKLSGSYPPAQAAPFNSMENSRIHDWIGSDKHVGIGAGIREVRTKTAVGKTVENGVSTTVYRTPQGEMRLVQRFDEASQSWHPVEFPVQTPEHVAMMTAIFEDVRVEVDSASLQKCRLQVDALGEDAVTAACVGESPLMFWVEWLAGVENAHYLLADHREEVEGLFAAIHRQLVRKTELLCEHNPADLLYMVENTSTTLISPDQYRRYCKRHVGEYARIAKQAQRNMVLHMCGKLKDLLPDLSVIPASAFEAFTSPTLGDTSFLDGRAACVDKCLVGGTNAMLWTRPAREIIAKIEQDLDELPHHRGIVVTSAGVMPPLCRPETIREVCNWVKNYKARFAA